MTEKDLRHASPPEREEAPAATPPSSLLSSILWIVIPLLLFGMLMAYLAGAFD